jgi:hypothetical protein
VYALLLMTASFPPTGVLALSGWAEVFVRLQPVIKTITAIINRGTNLF